MIKVERIEKPEELTVDVQKHLTEEFKKSAQKPWSNITISIKNETITYEFGYDNLLGGQEEYYDHHIYWRKKYLSIDPCGKKENKAYKKYLINLKDNNNHIKNETYMTGIYLKRQVNVVKYDTTDITKDERVDYLVEQEENKKIVNQILSQKL